MNVALPAALSAVLGRLGEDAARHFGGATARLEPVAYQDRPFSHVARVQVRVAGGQSATHHVFVKVFKTSGAPEDVATKRHRVMRDHDISIRVQDALGDEDGLGAVRPVACYPDLLALVTEEVAGRTLMEHVQREGRWFPSAQGLRRLQDTMASVGHWVRVFQRLEAGSPASASSIREYIDVRLSRMVRLAPARFTEDDRGRILRHIERLGAVVPPDDWRQVFVHSDLALGNVLVQGRRVVVLDFAMSKLGLALHDLARTSLQIELMSLKPQMRTTTTRALCAALLEGYETGLTEDRPLFRLMTLLHRVNNLGALYRRRVGVVESLYNRLVCRNHERWLRAELVRGEAR